MEVENPITNKKFELSDVEAKFFNQALQKFKQNCEWTSFENFAVGPNSPIYFRRKSFGKLKKDPLFRALQDMCLQLAVNQGELADDRKPGEKSFCSPE